MCTKSRAIALGCKVSGSYTDNQLVKYSDLSPNDIIVSFYLYTRLYYAEARGSYTCNGSTYNVSVDTNNINYLKSFNKIDSFRLGLLFSASYKESQFATLKVANVEVKNTSGYSYNIVVTEGSGGEIL